MSTQHLEEKRRVPLDSMKYEFLHYVYTSGKGPALCGELPIDGYWDLAAPSTGGGARRRYAVCPDCLLTYESLPPGQR